MRISEYLAKPLPKKNLIFVTIGILLSGFLIISLLVSLSQKPHTALADSNAFTPFTVTSPTFHDGGALSVANEGDHNGCTGQNASPELDWKNVPSGTVSFVMLMTDYDAPFAGGFHHWIVYNIPANVSQLKGNNAFTEGQNTAGVIGYTGPCPPPTGQLHHYNFVLYAINVAQIGPQGLTYDQVISAIQNSVVGSTSIIGTFQLPLN